MISTLVDLLGNFYASNDLINFEAMARSLHAAIPGDTISLQFLGLVYYRTGRVKDAKGIFDAIVKRPVAVLARCKRGVTAVSGERGTNEEVATTADTNSVSSAVAECYKEATRKRPYLAKAWYDLGMVFLELGRAEQAIAAFRNSLRANPDNGPAIAALAQAESMTQTPAATLAAG